MKPFMWNGKASVGGREKCVTF